MVQKEQMWPECSPALTRSGSSHLNGSVRHEIKIHRGGNQRHKFKSGSSSLVSSCSALTQLSPRWLLQSSWRVEMLRSRGGCCPGHPNEPEELLDAPASTGNVLCMPCWGCRWDPRTLGHPPDRALGVIIMACSRFSPGYFVIPL